MSGQVGAVPLLLTLPTTVSPAVERLVGTRLAEDTGDDLPCREPRALKPLESSLVSEMAPTVALDPHHITQGEMTHCEGI